MTNKKETDPIGELAFDEKTEILHQLTKTGFNEAQYRNLEQAIANSPSTTNFFSAIEEVVKEYMAQGLTRQEAIKRFCKENNEAKNERP